MPTAIVVGRPNAGKTLFALNFAEYLGLKEWRLERAGEPVPAAERRALVSPFPHTTRAVQSLPLILRAGKRRTALSLVDTAGLTAGIHGDPAIRTAQAMTIDHLLEADLILHLFDAPATGAVEEIDREVERFAAGQRVYAVLANKMDLPGAGTGLSRLRADFAGRAVFPISALRRQGFAEVKAFVARRL